MLTTIIKRITNVLIGNPVSQGLISFFETKSINYRVNLSITFVALLSVIAIYAQSQISKGALFHYLNYSHLKYSNEFSMEVAAFEAESGMATNRLETALQNVKDQPLQCLEVINFMDKMVMTMLGTAVAIDICERDLVYVENAERAIAGVKAGSTSKSDAIKVFTEAQDVFYRNSLAFDAPVVTTVEAIVLMMTVLTILMAFALGSILFFSIQSIRVSLAKLSNAAEGLTDGNMESVPQIGAENDTIGRLSSALEQFRKAALAQAELEENARLALEEQYKAEKQAEEARQKAAEEQQMRDKQASEEQSERNRLIEEVISNFEGATAAQFNELAASAQELGQQASELTEIAHKTRAAVDQAGNATDNSAHNVQAIASASEELTSSFSEINNQMGTTSSEIGKSVAGIEDARNRVQDLSDGAMKISRVVELISDIAEQTNLLALNATIEAARAGDAGKGFAVVASEVKSLANQTADATTEIEAQINVLQSTGQDATKAMESISKTFSVVEDMASQVSNSVSEQTSATSEITQNISSTAALTEELRNNMAVVQTNSVNTDQNAQTVTQTSQNITDLSGQLQSGFANFMDKVRNL